MTPLYRRQAGKALINESGKHVDVTAIITPVGLIRLRVTGPDSEGTWNVTPKEAAAIQYCLGEALRDYEPVPSPEVREALEPGKYDDSDPIMAALAAILLDGYATDSQRRTAHAAGAEILKLRAALARMGGCKESG